MPASWKTVAFIPSPREVPAHMILPLLLGAGALEVRTTLAPSDAVSTVPNETEPSWPPPMYTGEVKLSISVLWPDDLALSPDQALARAIRNPLCAPFPMV